jgi:PAS domain S-box-containing protein
MPTTAHVDLDYKLLFENLPDRYIVFHAQGPDYTILTASKAYLEMTDRTLTSIEGKKLFDAFPDTSPRAKKTGKGELRESLDRCVETKQPDHMGVIRYDITNLTGDFEVKYWSVVHTPALDADGEIVAIVQSTEDVTDEVIASDRLALNALQLDDALSAGSIGSWIWDVTNNKVLANKGLGKMFDLTADEVSDGLPLKTFIDVVHPDDKPRIEKLIHDTLKSGNKYEAEYRIVGKKNHERWVIARGRVERNTDGKVVRFPGVMVDITERKHAEQELQRSEDNLRFMADSMPQLVWVMNGAGKPEYFNKQWYEYTNTSPNDPNTGGIDTLIHPDDIPEVQKVWKKSLKTGEPYELEYRLRHAPSDRYRWVVARALPRKDKTGKVNKWYGVCTDIDEQNRSEKIQTFLSEASKALSSSLDYETTLDSITRLCVPEIADWCTVDIYSEEYGWNQIALAHVDPAKISLAKRYRELNPVDVNNPDDGLMRILRDNTAQFYPRIDDAMLVATLDDPDRLAFMRSLQLRSIIMAPLNISNKTVGAISFVSSESGRYYTEADFTMVKELASRISLSMTNATLYNEAQKEIQERSKLEDKLRLEKEKLESRVKQRTRQLQEYSDNLARSNQELQDFAYVASHDLQEPLRKIQAFGTLLANEYDESLGEGKDYLERMRNAAERMSTLIEDLLSFSRVTTQAKPDVPVDLAVVAKGVLSDLETRIQETHGTVEINELPTVVADPTQMRQLFQNLIGNALKFHREDVPPQITVTSKLVATSDSGFCKISIADNGIGFDEKYLDRIFSVFQRLHGRGTYEGTGIGLAVCKKIVERYGGTIGATSKKNQGSTFTFTIPVATKEMTHDN